MGLVKITFDGHCRYIYILFESSFSLLKKMVTKWKVSQQPICELPVSFDVVLFIFYFDLIDWCFAL